MHLPRSVRRVRVRLGDVSILRPIRRRQFRQIQRWHFINFLSVAAFGVQVASD